MLCSLARALDGHEHSMTDDALTIERSQAEQVLTGVVVVGAGALMLGTMGRAVVVLVLALGISYVIWLTLGDWSMSRRIVPVLLVALFIQCVHLGEEAWSEFY